MWNVLKTRLGESADSPNSVPRAGVEPARIAPLVFETSASTDSAIWAADLADKSAAKVTDFSEITKFYKKNLKKFAPFVDNGYLRPQNRFHRNRAMANINNNYCVILAGGKGRRLWPCSREQYPKQFIDFFGSGRTLLQQTFDRMRRLLPLDNIYINTNQSYMDLVRQQLPEVAPDHIMAEPIHRNTAPSIAWACHRISHLNPKANLLAIPSDQIVLDEAAFGRNVNEGFDFVSANDCLLTMGVKPTRPEPGYGYIQQGEVTRGEVYRVQSFTEKPDRDFARMFYESGEFFWNTGMFLANIPFLFHTFCQMLPLVLRRLDMAHPSWTIEEEDRYVTENFPSYPNMSIERGILEKSENVYVMRCNFGWADVGTWHNIYEAMSRTEGDNVVIDSDVIADGAHNNIIKLPKGRLGGINGLDGFIVAEEGNVLLICRKEDSSALIRKYVYDLQMKRGDDYV